jgi:hypothetical protein
MFGILPQATTENHILFVKVGLFSFIFNNENIPKNFQHSLITSKWRWLSAGLLRRVVW